MSEPKSKLNLAHLPDLLDGPKDGRVWLLQDIGNAILRGADLTPEQREKFKDFPYSLEWLDSLAVSRRDKGLSRIHVTPGPEATPETMAKELLAVQWDITHGRSFPLRSMDGPYSRRIDLRTGKRSFAIHWVWFADRAIAATRRLRTWIEKNVFGIRNPYHG